MIFRLIKEWSTYAWLCASCVAERVWNGWSAEEIGTTPWLTCDDCRRRIT